MSNNSVIGQSRNPEVLKDASSKKGKFSVWSGITGLILLSGAIGSLQNMSRTFANNVDSTVFIDNWVPWIAVLCFAAGWFAAHRVETILSKNEVGSAKLLFATVLVGAFLLSICLRFLSKHDVLQHFGVAPLFLMYSGYVLRYSTFSYDRILQMQRLVFGRSVD